MDYTMSTLRTHYYKYRRFPSCEVMAYTYQHSAPNATSSHAHGYESPILDSERSPEHLDLEGIVRDHMQSKEMTMEVLELMRDSNDVIAYQIWKLRAREFHTHIDGKECSVKGEIS
jgi:hypothetical protein